MHRRWLSPWLARFSFTFLILCGWLLWEAYKGATGQLGPVSRARLVLFLVGGMASFGLAIAGVRERHRAIHEDSDDVRRGE